MKHQNEFPPQAPSPTHERASRELIAIADEAARSYIRGDIDRYLALFDHADDYTLMPPYGGRTRHGASFSESQKEEVRRFFEGGDARFDLEQSFASGDLAVLVGIERQHGLVGGRPDQDWSLRVTWVFRRAGSRWAVVHRHADGLVREVSFDHFAELARGLDA